MIEPIKYWLVEASLTKEKAVRKPFKKVILLARAIWWLKNSKNLKGVYLREALKALIL